MDKKQRIDLLKGLIKELHAGGDPQVLKAKFIEIIKGVSAAEIAEMEQSLIDEGMPEEEVKKLCDVHLLIFQESLEEVPAIEYDPDHPLYLLALENRAAEKIIGQIERELKSLGHPIRMADFEAKKQYLTQLINELMAIDRHFLKKENQLFPRLEAKGISGPTKVMWALHDDIRAKLKTAQEKLREGKAEDFVARASEVMEMMRDMIYKEEKVLFPLSLETLNEADWAEVKKGEEEIGYAWIEPGEKPRPKAESEQLKVNHDFPQEAWISLDTGKLTERQVNALLKHLPIDVTFVDEKDTVRYYSQTKERIFPRSPGIIGRQVQNCHPPKSVHVVNQILEAFRKGEKDVAEFWLQMGEKMIHIRYFAVRDEQGKYLGCLEVSQDITAIKKLEGERRLLDWTS